MRTQWIPIVLVLALPLVTGAPAGGQAKFLSHPPMRSLPVASKRPLDKGPARFVDPVKGNDRTNGTEAQPWQTLGHAVKQLAPGDTLYLRGGTYYEQVTVTRSGDSEKPITIRSYPGELAILDGGLREFFEQPDKAWEKCQGGIEGEFWSAKTYPDLSGSPDGPNVFGNFADSMVPLHGYRLLHDLRSKNVYFHSNLRKPEDKDGIYCGPGIFYDVQSGRIHVRLAPTNMKYLPTADNYQGETDPRRLPLVIAGLKGGSPLAIRGVQHLRIQDLVVRGARAASIDVRDCAHIEFDGVTAYGGDSAFKVIDTHGLRLLHTSCRGVAAPWTFRGSLKYRGTEARIFSASGWTPTGADNRDFELAYSEFTDCVDGIFLGSVNNVRFHHNLVDNITDDGIFLTATTGYDGKTPGGDVHIYQNYFARCLTTFAFGVGHGRQKTLATGKQTGAGVHVYRNVFDFRRPVLYHQPAGPDAPQVVKSSARIASDHGSPAWEPMNIYHNTIIANDAGGYDYAALGLGRTKQRVFNNIVVQLDRFPSLALLTTKADLEADGNLFWSAAHGADADFLPKFRQTKVFAESKDRYPPGWTARDQFADPRFVRYRSDPKALFDLSLEKGSPAVGAGIELPGDWPDPLRNPDKGRPDVGALPKGSAAWRLGAHGRLTMFGEARAFASAPAFSPRAFAGVPSARTAPAAALVEGYPEFDAPMIHYLLRGRGVPVEYRERVWLDPKEYHKYRLVIIAGDLARAGIKTNTYSPAELAEVRKFLENGGSLWLLRRGKRVFDWTKEGQLLLQEWTGQQPPVKDGTMALTAPKHPWISHLRTDMPYDWLAAKLDTDTAPLRPSKGERIISAAEGTSNLYRVPVGKGQLIYMGWAVADSLPTKGSVEQEARFEEQVRILANILTDVYDRKP